jgi:hypothetical protein
MVHEHPAHGDRSDRQEVGATLQLEPPACIQAQVRLVHEGRRLQRVLGSFSPEVVRGQIAQLLVELLQQLFRDRGSSL